MVVSHYEKGFRIARERAIFPRGRAPEVAPLRVFFTQTQHNLNTGRRDYGMNPGLCAMLHTTFRLREWTRGPVA
jgi:hypothetical protein